LPGAAWTIQCRRHAATDRALLHANLPSRNIKNPNSFHGFDKEKIGMQALATYYNVTFF